MMEKVVIALFLLSLLYTRVTCFPCYRDECQSGVQYCVSERERCYLCKDRLDECGMPTMPKDCIILCENVLLNSRVSNLNNTVAELKNENTELTKVKAELTKVKAELTKVNTEVKQANTELTNGNTELTNGNTELKEKLNRANATIQDIRISLKEERENLKTKSSELNQHQEKWQIGVGVAAGSVVLVAIAVLVGYLCKRRRKQRLYRQSKPADADHTKDDKDIAGDSSTPEAIALLDKDSCSVKVDDIGGTSKNYAGQSESTQSKTTSSKSIGAIISRNGVNRMHSGSEKNLTDSGYSNGNDSVKSNTDDEIAASNDNLGNQIEVKGNANFAFMAKANSLVVNNNKTIVISETKATKENAIEQFCTNPPTTPPATPPATPPTNPPTNSQTNFLKGISPTTDDSDGVNLAIT